MECSWHTYALAIFGVLVLVFFFLDTLWTLLQGARAILAPYMLTNEEDSTVKKYGEWALVTGCTDGIGAAYAKELAKRGHSLILVSRTEEKLRAIAKDIENDFRVKTKIIQADFTKGPEAIEHIKKELGKLDVDVLVNNVGMQYAYPMFVGEVPEKELWDIININIGAVTLLTKMVIEKMRKRGKGAIVNVSSASELQPLPLMTVYAATKVYIKSFSEALRYEYSTSNVTIQHLSPMFVNTKMNKFSDKLQKSSLMVPDATTYAKYAVSTLGKLDHSTGYWAHGVQCFFIKFSPVWLRMIIGGSMNKSFRKDYFKSLN